MLNEEKKKKWLPKKNQKFLQYLFFQKTCVQHFVLNIIYMFYSWTTEGKFWQLTWSGQKPSSVVICIDKPEIDACLENASDLI